MWECCVPVFFFFHQRSRTDTIFGALASWDYKMPPFPTFFSHDFIFFVYSETFQVENTRCSWLESKSILLSLYFPYNCWWFKIPKTKFHYFIFNRSWRSNRQRSVNSTHLTWPRFGLTVIFLSFQLASLSLTGILRAILRR